MRDLGPKENAQAVSLLCAATARLLLDRQKVPIGRPGAREKEEVSAKDAKWVLWAVVSAHTTSYFPMDETSQLPPQPHS